ncbi:hypothetical protein EB72_18155 [Mycobacterium sp. SWH-M1]|nr:hypothetical protein EB72_18155 [Mycobacterium sp. SWH-M1]
MGAQHLFEARALDEAHVDEQHTVDLAEIVHGDDVRFLQPRRHPGLAAESFLKTRVGGHLRTQQLDRHHALTRRVIGAVHLAHAPDADHRAQLIGSEPRPHAWGAHCCFLSSRLFV